jgi:hypothetical protein
MREIEPVHLGAVGPKVTNLHTGLLFLIGHQGIPDHDVAMLHQQLAPDLGAHRFGEPTRRIVAMYQEQFTHWPNYWPPIPKKFGIIVKYIPPTFPGDVDEGMAELLNWAVEAFRKMKSPPPPRGNSRPAVILQKQTK